MGEHSAEKDVLVTALAHPLRAMLETRFPAWALDSDGYRYVEFIDRVAGIAAEAGLRATQECEACKGSGLYPNPTGVFYAPTEWLGCPDCMGATRVLSPAKPAPDLAQRPADQTTETAP